MLLDPNVRQRKPEWLRKKISFSAQRDMDTLLKENGIHTICQEAKCPNISECFAAKTATFLILGGICTRRCTYCNVTTGAPLDVNTKELDQIVDAVEKLGLKFVVITSPARDDLKDGGAQHFYNITQNILNTVPNTQVELLIPDFQGNIESIKQAANSGAVIVGHNIETIPRLYKIRKASVYQRSLDVLENIKKYAPEGVKTKSAIMLGLGESKEEVVAVFQDLLNVGCKLLSVGQYLAPSNEYEKVLEYVTPEQFAEYKQIALDMGFEYVHSSPYARSSYMAHEYVK